MSVKCSHTFSVIGKSKSTAHTGLGTKLRTSGSRPYTSPNCQVGTKPSCLKNLKRYNTTYRLNTNHIRLVKGAEMYIQRHPRAYKIQKHFCLNI